MTIGIAAISRPDGHIVAVSDQRISYFDEFPASDRGTQKIHQITFDRKWFLTFAADSIPLVPPLIRKVIHALKDMHPAERKGSIVRRAVEDAYNNIRREEFAGQLLAQLNYGSFDAFREEGLAHLGNEKYSQFIVDLAKFDLGVELLIFGFNEMGHPYLFSVDNPGRAMEWNWQGYGVIGSGCTLAMGSLRQRPISFDIEDLIYRVLEAKFVAESANTVGRSTTLVTMNQDGEVMEMPSDEIEAIRKCWEETIKEPIPGAAYDVIQGSRVVRKLSEGER